MTTLYRNSRINRTYLSRLTNPDRRDGRLTPDITTSNEAERRPVLDVKQARASAQAAGVGTSIIEERHPEIARAISLLWGYPEMNDYFDRLWLADGAHGPIDPDAMSELMLLARVHQAIVPARPSRTMAEILGTDRLHAPRAARADPWSDVPPRR